MKSIIDAFFGEGRLSYRAFLAWAVATGLLVAGVLDPSNWMILTSVFIGGEALPKIAKSIKGA